MILVSDRNPHLSARDSSYSAACSHRSSLMKVLDGMVKCLAVDPLMAYQPLVGSWSYLHYTSHGGCRDIVAGSRDEECRHLESTACLGQWESVAGLSCWK